MNKHLHRIIFNTTRGERMVVAETASAGGKAAGGETSGAAASPGLSAQLHPLRFAMLTALGMVLWLQPAAFSTVHAQIVAAPGAPANQRPTVLQTANGLPQVNIQTPSAAGVSRNTYQQFDVQPNGAILNNSRTNVQTQLGGFVGANPWLATGPARVILNEVNSGNPSQLRGYVEVAGQRAEVIIANPAGINVNGGGFLNANRVTLTTGSPVLNGGALEGFRVQGGNVSIGGAGLDTSTADYTAILARAVQVNAGIWAKELRVATGANDIDAAQHNATPIAGTGAAPSYAVDVAQLGGMYAGKIYLVGTETGLGVRNAGVIAATGGDLVLQANGWLTNTGSLQAAGNTQLVTAGAISNSGTVYAGGSTTLAGQGGISNGSTGIIAAQGNTSLQATGASITSAAGSVLAAGMNTDGTLRAGGDLGAAASGTVALNGQALAAGSVAVSGTQLNLADGKLDGQNVSLAASTGHIDASRATINAQITLSASAAQTLRTDAAVVSAGQLNLTAKDISNAAGEIVQTGTSNTTIALTSPTGTLNNSAGRIATNSQNLTLSAPTLNNTGGKIEHAGGGTLAINATTLNGDGGTIVSTGVASLSAATLSHNNATLSAGSFTVAAGTLNNRGGTLSQSGLGAASIAATGAIDNSAGKILSNGNTSVSAQSLNNQGGVVQATGASSLGVTTTATLDNSANGQVAAGGAATLNTGTLDNSGGKVTAGGSLTANAGGAITNVQGLLAANGATTLTAASLDNSRGTVASVQNNASITTTGATTNDSGRIEAAGDITLANTGLGNSKAAGQTTAGSITGRNIAINTGGQNLNNAFGTIAAAQGATLQTGALNNNAGLIQAGAALGINTGGQVLTNTNASAYAGGAGGITSQGAMTLATGDLNNAAGFIGTKAALNATTAAVDNTAAGQIVGESSLNFSSTAFDNRGGQVQALGDAGINTGTGAINNAGGLLRSGGTATLSAGSVINSNTLGANQGLEGNNVAITAGAISNDSGAIRADVNATVTSNGTLNNNGGLLSAGNAATVQDGAASASARTLVITNAGGALVAGVSLTAKAASLSGNGSLLSQQDLSLSLKDDFSNTGVVSAARNNTVSTLGTLTNSGKLQAGGALDVTAATIDNAAAGEMTGSTVKLTATDVHTLINRGLIDGVNTQINTVTLNNVGTGRIYGDTVGIAAITVNNDAETVGGVTTAATIAARQRLDMGATTINNNNGALIFSAGTGANVLNIGGSLDAGGNATGQASAVNNNGGTIESLGGANISAGRISNTNPNFSYALQGGGASGGSVREFVTLSGTFSSADGAWSLGPETLSWMPQGGGILLGVTIGSLFGRGAGGQALVIAPGTTFSAPIYQRMFNTPAVVPGGTVVVPPDPSVWALFGVAAPAGSPPVEAKPQPVCPGTSCGTGDHDDAMWIPPDPAAVAAWEAAAAPWLALQAAMDGAAATIAATAIPIEGFRDYTSTTQTAVIIQSTPGRILSSGAMTLNASTALVNDQSQIVAGGALNVTGQAVDNRGRTVSVNAQRSGTAYSWSNFNEGCGGFGGCDYNYNAYRTAPYVQDVPQTIALNVARSQSLLSPASQGLASGTQLGSANTGHVNTTITAPGAASAAARSAGIVQVTSAVAGVGAFIGSTPVVRTIAPNFTLPTASLFHARANPSPTANYIIETDPRFANYRNWLSSDYMLQALSLDPAATQKRLGDGFYEQRLVNEQVAQLTGQRFLAGYANEEAQYKALMDAGTTFAQQYQLRPGIALSAQQMAALTSDIVWLVEQTVTLADGSSTQALVPQVYARMKAGDLDGTGTLLAGQVTNLNLSGDISNTGTVAGRAIVNLTAENVNNLGGRISANDTSVTARNDLNNIGGTIDAANSLTVIAGRDLNIVSTTSSASNYTEGSTVNNFSRTGIDRVAGLYVTSESGTTLVASAGRDANLIGGVIANNGTAGNTIVIAQRDLNLGTVGTGSSASVVRGIGTDFLEDRQSADVGSQINTQGNLTLSAGRDLNAKAANVQAGGDLTAVAGNNINITSGQQTNSTSFGLTSSDGDLFSSTSSTERRSGEQSNAVGSSIGGRTITSVAGNDQTVTGSSVISDAGTTLSAGNNLTIQAATNTSKSSDFRETKEEGLMGSGGAGVTIGSLEQSLEQKTRGTTAAASTVGSIAGNVTLVANEAYKQVGSDVQAPGGDITIAAKKVDIVEARETSQSETEQKFKQGGLTFEVTSPIISAMQTIEQMSQAAGQTKDGRMKGLAAANSAFAVSNAYSAVQAGQNTTGNNPSATTEHSAGEQAGGINLAISIGSSESQSNSASQSNTARGSTVTAAGNVLIAATGAGQDSNLTIQGSTVEAGKAAQLLADNEVRLLAAQNTASQKSTNSSSSGSIGVSFGTDGFLVNASASGSRGKANGSDTGYTNTEIKAGTQATLTSGGDATLQGAVIKAETIKADVGGNLTIESLQDTSTYTSQQKSIGGSISVGFGKMSGSFNASKSNIDSDFKSVGEQSGIKAGDGGFQVNVAGNTTLNGSVIASNQAAVEQGKNSFQTGGTLNISDIQNQADYKASSTSIGASTGGTAVSALIQGIGFGLGKDSGSASSVSSAGISGIAGNTAVRSTDAETGLTPIFDAAKVQADIDAKRKITEAFGREASKVVGDYAASKIKEATDLRMRAQNATDPDRAKELEAQATGLEDNWGEYGVLRLLAHTAIGGLTGGASGAAGAAAGTLAAPAVAQALKDAGIEGPLANTLTALASTAAGALAGGTAGAGAALNEVANNYLSHTQWTKLSKDLAACKPTNTCDKVIADARQLNDFNDARLASACKDPSSAACVTLSMEAKTARDDQITLGIGVEVLGANANGKSDLIIGKVLSAQNLAASRQWCEANPKECITQLQGLGIFATGVLKGIPNAIPGALNIPSTILDGYINMYQAATGGTLTQLPKVPSITDCAPGLQSGGCVAGEVLGGVALGAGISAGLEKAAAAKAAAKAASTLEEGAAANGGSGTKLPIATDATATSPYSSSGTTYGKTTLTDANGNPIATQPSLPSLGQSGAAAITDATASVSLADRAVQIRADLSIGGGRNIAVAQYTIDGNAGELVGVSGQASRPGTVNAPKNSIFDTIQTGNNPRTLDSEYKILSELATKLTSSSKGVVNLYSELPVCASCNGVIDQFRQRFPGVTVNVITGKPG